MIVNLTNEIGIKIQLKILFWKTPLGERRRKHGRELIDTTCQISIVSLVPTDANAGGLMDLEVQNFIDEYSKMVGEVLASGVAKQNPLDNYNKIIGRKIALSRAISIAMLRTLGCSLEDGNTRRLMRQQIWTEFHKTFGRWS